MLLSCRQGMTQNDEVRLFHKSRQFPHGRQIVRCNNVEAQVAKVGSAYHK